MSLKVRARSIEPSPIFAADYEDHDANYQHGYNWQVFLVPTDSWRSAVWAASRSSRFVGDTAPDGATTEALQRWLARLYRRQAHPPILWYTPGGALGDEVYEFLYRLEGLGNLCVFNDDLSEQRSLQAIDQQNLQAMLIESQGGGGEPERLNAWSSGALDRRFCRKIQQPLLFDPENPEALEPLDLTRGPGAYFKLARRMQRLAPRQRLRGPRVAIVITALPQLACALAPLAAYIQANLVMIEPNHSPASTVKELVKAVHDREADELWLVGTQCELESELLDALRPLNRERMIAVRKIAGDEHFAASHHAALLLTSYRYLDWMLTRALVAPGDWDQEHFRFLRSDGMRTLYYEVSRVISLARRLGEQDYAGLSLLHSLYWAIDDPQRRLLIEQFQNFFKDKRIVTDGLCVVADYAEGEPIPHNMIDAAAMASRRAAPLLILRPLTAETSAYVGALNDKIEEHLTTLHRLRDKRLQLIAELDPVIEKESDDGADVADPASQQWTSLERRLDVLHGRLGNAQSMLQNSVWKTGEVLYESLIPLAMRRTLAQINPRYLSVFIQDPNLPIELIRDSEGAHAEDAAAGKPLPIAHRFWSLRYAIGHVSSVNLYETNLTSNITSFASHPINPAMQIVLMCANPTGDLHYSGEEADSIEKLFTGGRKSGSTATPGYDWDVVRMSDQKPIEDLYPSRDHFSGLLRSGPRIAHYSGHAFFDSVLPGRSGLLLRDGVLTAANVRLILELDNRPLIYASACAAGRVKAISSRFTGLAAAFMRAGASGYISSLWSIDDREAAGVAVCYYQALLSDSSPSGAPKLRIPIGECLRLAKQAQAQEGTIAWASLVLYGDPTMTIDPVEDEGF